jgi:hypothetical protein
MFELRAQFAARKAALRSAVLMVTAFALVGVVSLCRGDEKAAVQPANAKLGYNQFIRPILSENCFYCHGNDKNHRQSKLRLDDRDSALKGGKSGDPAIVPGNAQQSELIDRITSADPDDVMPPPKTHKTLTARQKQILTTWIAQGAEYEPFWAYIAPKRFSPPAVSDPAWVQNPIDAFVLHELDAHDIKPSAPANRAELLRRVSLDLIGLPPTPEELSAYLSDTSPDAYEKQVDRLLASPHYGERMAVPWLDAVRFADTVGFHGDQNQNVYPYRDYVINAFNSDKPFDQFVIEQMAGDLLPNPTTEQRVATCFNRLNMVTREGGAQAKEYLAKYSADRVRTLGSALLGSTLACCECHDHKFDPFTSRDFYSFAAFWDDVKQWGIYTTYKYTPNPDLKGFTNDHPFPPEIVVDSPYMKARLQRFKSQFNQLLATEMAKMQEDSAAQGEFAQWRQAMLAFLAEHPDGWMTADVDVGDGKTLKANPDRSVVFIGKAEEDDKVPLKLPAGTWAAIRLELLPQNGDLERKKPEPATKSSKKKSTTKVAAAKPASKPDAAKPATKPDAEDEDDEKTVSLKPVYSLLHNGKPTELKIFDADSDNKQRYSNGSEVLDVVDGWTTTEEKPGHGAKSSKVRDSEHVAVYILQSPVKITAGDKLVLMLSKNLLTSVRISVSPIAPIRPANAAFASSAAGLLASPPPLRDDKLQQLYLSSTGWDAAALAQMHHLEHEILYCRDGESPVLTTETVMPKITRILARGNWQDDSGAIVTPATPGFLPQLPEAKNRRLSRLDLAHWLVAPENPLVSRAFVNRLWKQYFGNGLCNTVEDLGTQGEFPSHPELLDWLAVEFRESGWDVKHMVRLIVLSNTYRQSSNLRPELKDIDPANRLLASQNPRRLEAEFVRDNALAISGLIDLDIGGPSAKPYQPAGYYVNIQFPSREYVPDTDEQQYRRGVYMHWQRTFLHPMLANFDAPSREDSICTRNVSNTPQQALTLLNDPTFVEAARVLAEHVMGDSSTDAQRLANIYQRVLCRPPRANEAESLTAFLAQQREHYRANRVDAAKLLHVGFAPVPPQIDGPELAAWTTVCRVVLNLHETITRY